MECACVRCGGGVCEVWGWSVCVRCGSGVCVCEVWGWSGRV